MAKVFFKNVRYRAYFEFLDSFRNHRCSLCGLITGKEQEAVAGLISRVHQAERIGALVAKLCAFHRAKIRELLRDGPQAMGVLKAILTEKCRELANVSPGSSSLWRWRLRKRSGTAKCSLCQEVQSQEWFYCRALVDFLDEMDFWKRFQMALPLCLDHLRKCLVVGNAEKGLSRLRQDERAKLSALLDELIRFEATGMDGDSKARTLEWLVDSKKEKIPDPPHTGIADQDELLHLGAENSQPSNEKVPHPEELLFENEKLKRKIEDLTRLFSETESRAASLHYRVAELTETNNRLEMAHTGANVLASGLENVVKQLREEIKKLKAAKPAHPAKPTS